MYRNPILLKAKVVQTLFVCLFVGGIYFGAGDLDYSIPANFSYITGFLFFMTISSLLSVLSPVALEFPVEKVILYK
jgi:hypothetical protein